MDDNRMNYLKKFGCFFGIVFCLLGLLGGIGYAIYGGGYPIAVGVAVLGYAAYPKFKSWLNGLAE